MYHDIILVPNILGICEVGCLVSYLHIDGRHHHVQNHCEHNAKRRICSCTCIGIPRRDCLGQKYFGCLVSYPSHGLQLQELEKKWHRVRLYSNTASNVLAWLWIWLVWVCLQSYLQKVYHIILYPKSSSGSNFEQKALVRLGCKDKSSGGVVTSYLPPPCLNC